MTLKTICEEYYRLEDRLADLALLLQAAEDEQRGIEARLLVSVLRSQGVSSYEPAGGRSNAVSNPTLELALEELKREDRASLCCAAKIARLQVKIARMTQRLIPLRRLMDRLAETDRMIIQMRYGPVRGERPTIDQIAEAVNMSTKSTANRIQELSKYVPWRLSIIRESRSRLGEG